MVIEPSGCKKHTLAYFSFTWCLACTAALYENMATSVSYAKRTLICEWTITFMFSNKIATMCYVDERSLLLLFLSQYSFLTCPFSKELENGWLGIFPLTSALYRPAWAGRPVWAEAVSILMLLASLLIRLFFKRTKQIIQSESKSIKQWLWFSPLLFRNNKEEDH